jgi:hypothetical protein
MKTVGYIPEEGENPTTDIPKEKKKNKKVVSIK